MISQPLQNLVELSHTFEEYIRSNTDCNIPEDFLLLTVETMKHLQASGRSNVLYKLAKGLGTVRPDGSDSLFPAKQMPMGLIEYNELFYFLCQTRSEDFTLLLSIHEMLSLG